MKCLIYRLSLIFSFSLLIGAGTFIWYLKIYKESRIFLLGELKEEKGRLNKSTIKVAGRVYQDMGGNFWIVSAIGKTPVDSYVLQLTAWPFKQSPPQGLWSTYLNIKGSLACGDTKDSTDYLIGPSQIEMSDPPKGVENYGDTSEGDPFSK